MSNKQESLMTESNLEFFCSEEIQSLQAKREEYKTSPFELQYALSLINVLDNGTLSQDRTGVGTFRIQSQDIHIDLTKEFPILVGKAMNAKNALIEMIWIMKGRTDLDFLKDNGVNYWDQWVKEDGTFGPIYGKQMRDFFGVDQLKDVVEILEKNPDSRRITVSLWNPKQLPEQALPPCHHNYQICSFIDHDGIRKMDLHVYQRSADSFIGVPYDFMLFSYYLYIVSVITGIPVNKVHVTMADYHMYINHEEQVKEYLVNFFKDPEDKLYTETVPTLSIAAEITDMFGPGKNTNIDDLLDEIIHQEFNLLRVDNYTKDNHYKYIAAPVAV